MSEITYNEEVTAEVMNNISVDLGSAEFSYFEDGVPYAVGELNRITADLVSPGVLRVNANGDLGCAVTASGESVYVGSGVIVFASGAKLRITGPVAIELVPQTVIFAVYDDVTGNASLKAQENVPTGDCVLLAKVDKNGAVSDMRSACVAKTSLTADTPNTYREVTVTLENVTKDNNTFMVDMGTNAYRYIQLLSTSRVTAGGKTYVGNIKNERPFLSEEGVENKEIIYMNYTTISHSYTRNGQYQEIRIYGGEGVFYEGTYTLKLMIM